MDADGKRAVGSGGYFYFGAAKDLPGVRDQFDQSAAPSQPRATRYDLYKQINADYYGYRDDDDGLLLKLEQIQEKKARDKAKDKWVNKQIQLQINAQLQRGLPVDQSLIMQPTINQDTDQLLQAHVHIVNPHEQAILDRKKKALLAMFTSTDPLPDQHQQSESSD